MFRGDREQNSTLAPFRGDNEEKEAVRGDSAPILGLVGVETWMSAVPSWIHSSLSGYHTGVASLCGTEKIWDGLHLGLQIK